MARIRIDDEAQWLACPIPRHQIRYLKNRTSDRKLRLWACASARQRFGAREEWRAAIALAEEWADGKRPAALEPRTRFGVLLESAYDAAYDGTVRTLEKIPYSNAVVAAAKDKATEFQLATLFDIFGNPFRPVTCNPAWITTDVRSVASTIYEERELFSGLFDNVRLAVLADALQDAGCDNADILNHCRSGGEHVRGCWVVDLLLARE